VAAAWPGGDRHRLQPGSKTEAAAKTPTWACNEPWDQVPLEGLAYEGGDFVIA
jgi:hypothetical protein